MYLISFIIIIYLFLREIGECFNELSEKAECRVVILSGAGKLFCAGKIIIFFSTNLHDNIAFNMSTSFVMFGILGIDFIDATNLFQKFDESMDVARKAKILEKAIKQYQNSLTAIDKVHTVSYNIHKFYQNNTKIIST